MTSSPQQRTLVIVGAVAATLVAAAFLLLPYDTLITRVIMDDAFYYVRVALNVTSGQGLTYDGVTWTNGFHPLWGVLLLLPAVSGSDLFTLYAGLALSVGFVGLGVWSLVVIARELGWGAAGALAAIAAFVFPRADLYMSLMESGPSAGLLLAGLALGTRQRWLTSERASHAVLFGLWLAAIFLVRLDFAFIVATAAAAALLMRLRSGRPMRSWLPSLSLAGVVAAVPAGAYLLANRLAFGHFVPVSGRKKHVYLFDLPDPAGALLAGPDRLGAKIGLDGWVVVALGVVLLMAVGAGAVLQARSSRTESATGMPRLDTGGMLLVLFVGTLLRASYMRVFVAIEANRVPWYWVPENVVVACLVGFVVALLVRHLHTWTPALARLAPWAVLVLAWPLGTAFVLLDNDFLRAPRPSSVLDAARWTRDHAGSYERCAFYDSGMYSWESGLPCVSLNGLISDEETMELAKEERFAEIMDRHGVDLYVEYCSLGDIERAGEGVIWHSDRPERLPRLDGPGYRVCLFDRAVYRPYADPAWERP